jgi:predicted phage terminase large subunit-like protein
MIDQSAFQALLRQDLASFIAKCFGYVSPAQTFVRNWHIDALAWHLEQCRQGRIRRLIITLPPRHLKSISASVAFPAFVLGHDPTTRIVCVSYAAELAGKLARDCRAIMASSWYRQLFPGTRLSREKNSELDFVTTQRGYRLSTSVGGVLTGRGGNLIILDDPMKPDEAMSETRRRNVCDWFDNTLYSRLDDKRSDVIILIMQRLHMDDLVGHVLAKDDSWVHLNLPAIAEIDEEVRIGDDVWHFRRVGDLLQPVREPRDVIEDMRRSLGSYHFAAQYQQAPIPPEGELLKWSWFRAYDVEPVREPGDEIVQSWDTASKAGELNDYSVCTTWLVRGETYYLLDVHRAKLHYPDLKRAVAMLARQFGASAVIMEDKASGTALIQDLAADPAMSVRPIAVEPEGDKVTRASAQSMVIEAGRVFLPRSAAWLSDLRNEILQFPNGRHDDQVDSITQFLHWIRTRIIWATDIKVSWVY